MNNSVTARTIVLKLYKPGAGKRQIIDEAMRNYSRAFQYLLDRAWQDEEEIREKYKDERGYYSANTVVKWMSKAIDRSLNQFSIEPFKDSIKIDFSGVLAGYMNLKRKDASAYYPSAFISQDVFEREYNKLMGEIVLEEDSEEALKRISKITDKAERFRAIYFCRYSTKRNYSILYDPEKNKYFAKIYLMNVKNEKRKRLSPKPELKLYYISKKEEVFSEGQGKKSFVIFPLAFGKWQEEYLEEAIENPEIIKTARLTKNGNEYYLSINLVWEKTRAVEPENYLGISRGIENLVNYSVINKNGEVLDYESDKNDDSIIDVNRIHKIANRSVEIAKKYKCQIILEQLTRKGDRILWKDKDGRKYEPLINVQNYNQLCSILQYKLEKEGLPPLIKVSGINIFNTCPECLNSSRGNRFSKNMLICISCGMSMDIERAGSINLARKLLKYRSDKIKVKAEHTDRGIRFVNKDIGLMYYPENPYDCADEFREELSNIIKRFHENIKEESLNDNFKKKYSFIKKLEENEDKLKLISIE